MESKQKLCDILFIFIWVDAKYFATDFTWYLEGSKWVKTTLNVICWCFYGGLNWEVGLVREQFQKMWSQVIGGPLGGFY